MAERKNPHNNDTPEWQIWEGWNTCDALIRAADDDVRRAEQRRSEAVARRAKYAAALERLGHKVE